jgi:hypothetical protein
MTGDDATPSDREILVRLLDATPLPTPGCDVEPLLETLDGILAARDEILAQIVPPLRVADADRPLLEELERREALWQEALCDAQHRVGTQRCGAGRLRAYAPTI